MQHSARYYLSILDDEREKRYTSKLNGLLSTKDVTSPTSGRLQLPPPTSSKKSSKSGQPVGSPSYAQQSEPMPIDIEVRSQSYSTILSNCEEGISSNIMDTTSTTTDKQKEKDLATPSTLSVVVGNYFSVAKAYSSTPNSKHL